MADSRRQTRSTRRREQQTDAQFWNNQPDPLMIERGQADAIRLVRSSVNPASETASGPIQANAINVSGVPPVVFVEDKGLEEQFLTDGEDTTNVQDTSANRVTTPVNTTPTNRSIQHIQHEELDLQPSRGPRDKSIVHTIDQFLDENYLLSLPPPVQTPKRQGNNKEDLEHSQNSRKHVKKNNTVSREERRNETVTSAQGEPREFREHSRESLDPMESIRNLHIQQRQNRGATEELNQNTLAGPLTTRTQVNQVAANLITFSPVVEQQVPASQGAMGVQVQPK